MLRPKCITARPEKSDGWRISIMSRHTLNDGLTPDPKITPTRYNEWWKMLAPPDQLIGDYYKRNLSWLDFEERFNDYLNTSLAHAAIVGLAIESRTEDTTIMCIEKTPDHCHRRLVAEACRLVIPELEVVLK